MTGIDTVNAPQAARVDGGQTNAVASALTRALYLAAAPTFAIMALLTGVLGGGRSDILCSAAEHTSPLIGMIPMYVLISAFLLPPWLKLISNRRKRRPPGVITRSSQTTRQPAFCISSMCVECGSRLTRCWDASFWRSASSKARIARH